MEFRHLEKRWNKLTEDINGLTVISNEYLEKLEEVVKILSKCDQEIAYQRCELGVIDRILQKLDVPGEEKAMIETIKQGLAERTSQLAEIEHRLPKEDGTYLKVALDKINCSILEKDERTLNLTELLSEMLEAIALYLPCDSIKACKCVNKYINMALDDSKRVWRKLLYYPERYYESDCRSGSTAAGVQEVLEDLSTGQIELVKASYKLQQARLQQWRNNRCEEFDEIILPSRIDQMREMVNDEGIRWLFILDERKLHIWNITATPQFHGIVEVFPRAKILSLLHQGYLMMQLNEKDIAVYQFEKPDYRLQLMYRFTYNEDGVKDPSIPVIDCGWFHPCNYVCSVTDDLFIAFDQKITNARDLSNASVHIWKVSSGVKLAKARLHIDILNKVESSCNVVLVGGCRMFGFDVRSFISSGNSSNVLIALECLRTCYVVVFNLKTYTFTHIVTEIHEPLTYEILLHMYADKVCCVTRKEVIVYSVPTQSDDGELLQGRLLKTVQCVYCEEDEPLDENVQFKHSKVIVRNNVGGVLIISLDSSTLPAVQVMLDGHVQILGLIEPNLLIVHHWTEKSKLVGLKVIDTLNNTALCTWEDTEGSSFLVEYYSNLVYPSKLGVLSGEAFRFFAL